MGHLSTHVLDTMRGQPARDVAIDLHVMDAEGAWRLIKQTRTNSDGRTDEPLLSGNDFHTGTYMLSFHMGDYFAGHDTRQAIPPFLDIVPLRFSMTESDGQYHVPLLASPWSYSTYRGS